MMEDRPWLAHALESVGIRERPGRESHPLIAEGFALVGLSGADDDRVAWCSAVMCAWMERAGCRSTRRADARSWLGWGEPSGPKLGAVAVLWRGSRDDWRGHVGLLLHSASDTARVLLVSGNAGNAVSVGWYARERVLGYRWPTAAELVARA